MIIGTPIHCLQCKYLNLNTINKWIEIINSYNIYISCFVTSYYVIWQTIKKHAKEGETAHYLCTPARCGAWRYCRASASGPTRRRFRRTPPLRCTPGPGPGKKKLHKFIQTSLWKRILTGISKLTDPDVGYDKGEHVASLTICLSGHKAAKTCGDLVDLLLLNDHVFLVTWNGDRES